MSREAPDEISDPFLEGSRGYQIPLNCPKDEASLWRKLRISRQQLFRLIHAGALEVDPESLVSTGFLDCTPRISNSIILGSILIFS